MTELILRALGETDERFFLAFAETMKEKSPKKIILRRWIAAAAAVIIVVGTVFALPPVWQALFQKNNGLGFVQPFDSFEEMMERAGHMETEISSGDPFRYGTRLSLLDFSLFSRTEYYICWETKGPTEFTLAMGPPFTFVCDLKWNGVRYEIANCASDNSMDIPTHFCNTEKYANTVRMGDIVISYEIMGNRSECEFTDATGYYKIICHTGDEKALSDIVEMLLGDPLFLIGE